MDKVGELTDELRWLNRGMQAAFDKARGFEQPAQEHAGPRLRRTATQRAVQSDPAPPVRRDRDAWGGGAAHRGDALEAYAAAVKAVKLAVLTQGFSHALPSPRMVHLVRRLSESLGRNLTDQVVQVIISAIQRLLGVVHQSHASSGESLGSAVRHWVSLLQPLHDAWYAAELSPPTWPSGGAHSSRVRSGGAALGREPTAPSPRRPHPQRSPNPERPQPNYKPVRNAYMRPVPRRGEPYRIPFTTAYAAARKEKEARLRREEVWATYDPYVLD